MAPPCQGALLSAAHVPLLPGRRVVRPLSARAETAAQATLLEGPGSYAVSANVDEDASAPVLKGSLRCYM